MTCTVYVRDRVDRRLIAGHVTDAQTVFGACRQALAWFESDHGRAVRFSDDTVLEVQLVGSEKIWYVRAGAVRRSKADQQTLFDSPRRQAFDPQ